jgi:hypothetical protein
MNRNPPAFIALLYITVSVCLCHATEPRFGQNTSPSQADVIIKKSDYGYGSLSPGRLGDINGDGFDDFAIGDFVPNGVSPTTVGIFFGRERWDRNYSLSTADIVVQMNPNQYLGYQWPLYPGDLNNDG